MNYYILLTEVTEDTWGRTLHGMEHYDSVLDSSLLCF